MSQLMNRLIEASLFFLIISSVVYAQDSLWLRQYGGLYNETAQACRQLSGGDIILFGSTYSFGAGSFDMYLVRTDSAGAVLWYDTYGTTGTEYGNDCRILEDGSIVLAGSTKPSGSTNRDMSVAKVGNTGIVSWSRHYGGNGDDEANSIQETFDGGLMICGTTHSFGNGSDIYLVRADSIGDTLWTRRYGGPAGESGNVVRSLSDSGFVIIGSTGSYGLGYSSVYVVRIDKTGDTVWTKTFGGSRADLGYDIVATSDNGFIIAGVTVPDGENYYDAYLVKIDSLGNLDWEQTYGGPLEDKAYSVIQTQEGGYLFTGTSEVSGGRKTDIFIVKVDPIGAVEWSRTYGSSESDYSRSVLLTNQDDFLISGYSFTSFAGSDVYLLKIRGDGATAVDDRFSNRRPYEIDLKQNYPNPFNSSTIINFSLPGRSDYRLIIYNLLGQIVREWKGEAFLAGEFSIGWDGADSDGNAVPSGVYLYRITAVGMSQARKMVLLK